MAPTLTLHEGDSERTFEPPTTGPELIAQGCRMMAEWFATRAADLPPADRLQVRALVA